MNDDARKGRKIVLVIPLALSFLLWRGYGWARSYLAFGLGLGAILAALGGTPIAISVWWGFLLLLFPPLYAWGAWALWSSPKVEAYIAHRERERNPGLSFSTGDGNGA